MAKTTNKTKSKENFFLVSFDGLDLTKEQKTRIEKSIQELMLREIAHLDHGGDIKISRSFAGRPTWEDLWKWGQLAGFWIEGFPNFPPGGPSGPR